MARIRSIRPELWDAQKLGSLSVLARLTFIGLISIADDQGRGRGDVRFLMARLHAYASDISRPQFEEAVRVLAESKMVRFYEIDGAQYYTLPGWKTHQKIDKPKDSLLPNPPKIGDESATSRRQVDDASATSSPRMGVDGMGREEEGMGLETTAPSAGDLTRSLAERLTQSPQERSGDWSGWRLSTHLPGKLKGACIDNLSPDDCSWGLGLRPNKSDKQALEWRIKLRQEETAR